MTNPIIPKGVFSRLFTLKNGLRKAIVYNTPMQSVAVLDGDSANVWQLIYENNGDLRYAHEYIAKNGKFQGDRSEEARSTLASFIENLIQLNLLVGKNGNIYHNKDKQKTTIMKDRVNPFRNINLSIGQVMADNHVLYSLVLELTYRCNERCVHCYCPSNRDIDEMKTADIKNLLIQFKELGGFKLQLTGGEIFVRKDIKDILNIVKDSRIVLDITSNLTLLSDDILKIIQDIHPRSVGCSIYSARADLHDKTTNLNGSFEQSIDSIRKLRSLDIPVVIKTPLMSHTVKYWREIEDLADSLGCEYQLDLTITAKNDGGMDPTEYRVKDIGILTEIMSSRYYKLYINDEPMNISKTPSPDAILCGAGANGLTISPDGSIRPCIGLSTKIGLFPQDSLTDVWNGSDFFAEWASKRLIDIKKCSKCTKIAHCNRCPGAWQAENGNYETPTEYTCFLADVWSNTQKQ